MALPKYSVSRFMVYLTLTASICLGNLPMAVAQEYVPPDRGLPGRREGGGTRGGCVSSQPSLTALMPATNFGTTVSEYPTFLWYLPQTTAQSAEFVLLSDRGDEIYKSTFQITGQPGIISLSLPHNATLPPLEIGKDYHWFFSLVCDENDRSGDAFAEGWIQRIQPTPDLTRRMQSATIIDRPTLYAQSGIWYDAIASLAEQRRIQPTNANVNSRWRTLLNSVGLSAFADKPLVQCCEPATNPARSTNLTR